MDQPVQLKSFEYSIPAIENGFHPSGNLYQDYLKMNLPLVKINIDFENDYLILESNGFPAMSVTSKTEHTKFSFEKERIKVNARIYCGLDIHLSGSSEAELVFLLEGVVDDGENRNPCSGLIVIGNRANTEEFGEKEWELRISLYDNSNDDREIQLALTMHSLSQNAELN